MRSLSMFDISMNFLSANSLLSRCPRLMCGTVGQLSTTCLNPVESSFHLNVTHILKILSLLGASLFEYV